MELKEFVQVSLVQIAQGIDAANTDLEKSEARVNPKNLAINAGAGGHYGKILEGYENERIVELVEFDVAITVSEGNEKNGKIGLSVGSIGIGMGGKNMEANSYQSRIRFKIPVAWPRA